LQGIYGAPYPAVIDELVGLMRTLINRPISRKMKYEELFGLLIKLREPGIRRDKLMRQQSRGEIGVGRMVSMFWQGKR